MTFRDLRGFGVELGGGKFCRAVTSNSQNMANTNFIRLTHNFIAM
jgi:hypothetical protein